MDDAGFCPAWKHYFVVAYQGPDDVVGMRLDIPGAVRPLMSGVARKTLAAVTGAECLAPVWDDLLGYRLPPR
jgi:hypothetical protein